jgi:lipopolysaccharide biosynthesis regulator YciM
MSRLPDVVVRVKLSAEAAVALRKPVRGVGGFQSALRRIQSMMHDGDVLILSVDDLHYLARLATRYQDGGFQNRLKSLFRDLRELANTMEPFARP